MHKQLSRERIKRVIRFLSIKLNKDARKECTPPSDIDIIKESRSSDSSQVGLVEKGNYIDGRKHVNLRCLFYATERYCAALSKIFLITPRITFRCGQKVKGKRKKSEFKSW